MTSGGARRSAAYLLAAAPAALVATAIWTRIARGPAWLAFNFDPTYAYLLNSLTILEGYPPFLIHHPGLPLQAIGSIVIAALHAATGHGPMAADVIARPETFSGWIHAVAVLLSAALVFVAGLVVDRRAGNGAAFLVQIGPWLSITAASLLGQMRAEVLIAGTATLWAAFIVAHVARPDRGDASHLGAATGVTLALHMSSLPLLLAPLLLLEAWRDRRRFLLWTGGSFLIAFAPGWLKLPSFAKQMAMIALHAGHYGTGAATIVDVGMYLPSAAALVAAEPIASAIVAVSLGVWGAWTRVAATDDEPPSRRALGALTAMQIVAFALTAKHPDPHYLVAMHCTLGANLWLVGRWAARRRPAFVAPAGVGALAAIAAWNGAALTAEAARLRAARGAQEEAARMTDAIVRRDGCFTISAYRASSEQEALEWANLTAQYRGRPLLGAEIAGRFPRAAFDEGHLSVRDADWRPIDLGALMSREPCVIYAGEISNAPSTNATVTVEPVGTSGAEGIYRLSQVR
jgi:hypothetical protein